MTPNEGIPPVRHPPWLWLYLVFAAFWVIPGEIATASQDMVLFAGLREISGASPILLRAIPAVELIPAIFLAAGSVVVFVPQLRCWLVERNHPPHRQDPDIQAAMQQFVDRYSAGVEVRLTVGVGDARVYPVGWRRARILVFHSLYLLWKERRREAQAILLHEIAHRRQGEHLILGIGSPFSWLVRVWGVLIVPLAVFPVVILLLNHSIFGTMATTQLIYNLSQPLSIFVFPIAAIWLAEFSADAWAARVCGSEALLAILATAQQTPVKTRWHIPLLDHPPLRLRRAMIATRGSAGPPLASWPATVIPAIAIALATGVPALLVLAWRLSDIPQLMISGTGVALDSATHTMVACMVALWVWPRLSAWWPRIWEPHDSREEAQYKRASTRRSAARSYVRASLLPALLLIGTAIPTPEPPPPNDVDPAFCDRQERVAASHDELAQKFQDLADMYASIHDDAGEARNRAEARGLKEKAKNLRQDMREIGCS
jgi:Zn-dependent protease with chaperone function